MPSVDILLANAGPLVTMSGADGTPSTGKGMSDVGLIEHGAVAIRDGLVLETGPHDDMVAKYAATEIVDAERKLVTPGLVDGHTHLVFGGSREREMTARLRGKSYLDILDDGGGIHSTVRETGRTPVFELAAAGLSRLDRMAAHGTTTVEIKTGYGGGVTGERMLLEVIDRLAAAHALDVVSTYLGAHAIPANTPRDRFLARVTQFLERETPAAEFFDVFCDAGAFTADETVRLLRAAKQAGYKLKVHAGQFSDLGIAGTAAALGAVSCDHLEHVSDDQLGVMKQHGTVAVLMPGVPFFLRTEPFPDARRLIDAGVPVALATDFNPGSCPCFSMAMIMALGVLECGMSPSEALTAATRNAAFAVDRGDVLGSLTPGKQADAVLWDVTSVEHIPYFFGGNLVRAVVKRGDLIYSRSDVARRHHGV